MPWHTSPCGTVFDITHYNNVCGYVHKKHQPHQAQMPASWYDPPNPERVHWQNESAEMQLPSAEEMDRARAEAQARADANERASIWAREAIGGSVPTHNNMERKALWFVKRK